MCCRSCDHPWPPEERVSTLEEFMGSTWLLVNVLISIALAFAFCLALTYPLLEPGLTTMVFSQLNLSFILSIPLFTPISIAMFEPLTAYYLSRCRHLIHWQVHDSAISRSASRFFLPFVLHPNQMLSSLLFGVFLTILTAWLVLAVMYAVYLDRSFGRLAISLWTTGYCTLIAVPSAVFVSLAAVTESAFVVYSRGVCGAYWRCCRPEPRHQLTDLIN